VTGDLHLTGTGGGAAIDQGAAVTGFTDDIDGNQRPIGAAWDIGAHEWSSAGSLSPPTLLSVDPVPGS